MKCHISKTTTIWAVFVEGNIHNPWQYSDGAKLQGWEFQICELFYNLSFLKISEKNHKNRISKTKKVWIFLIGRWIYNPWDYSESLKYRLAVPNYEKRASI